MVANSAFLVFRERHAKQDRIREPVRGITIRMTTDEWGDWVWWGYVAFAVGMMIGAVLFG